MASEVLFLDLVVVMRLCPWNNSSSHTFVLCGFLYLCSFLNFKNVSFFLVCLVLKTVPQTG